MVGDIVKTVRILKRKNPSIEFKIQLDNLIREFCSAKRYAFNRLLEENKPKKVDARVNSS